MSLTFNPTSFSLITTRALLTSYNNLNTSLERLTTGLRITDASSDPAGSSVKESFRAEVAGIQQGIRNAEDGVSLLQTAESGLSVIDEKLTRMKELAEQSSTSTYTDSQRLIMQSEFELMASEIDRIATTTDFNGIKLLDGSISQTSTWSSDGGWNEPNNGVSIHFGSGAERDEDYYYLSIPDVKSNTLLKGNSVAVSTQSAAQNALDHINTAIQLKENARAWVGALQNRLEGTIAALENEYVAKNQAIDTIANADIATEMTNYVHNLILTQSAIAMLGQTNILPSLALDLLESL